MKFAGETQIAAPREKVWESLNDPAVLKACIPGCDALEPTEDGGFTATVRQRIGPVSATFEGRVAIEDPNPPNSYRLVGQGSGGIAGFAKGGALVTLEATEDGTLLRYDAEAQLGGKIAQLGGRLVSGVASKVADQFFEEFGRQVTGEPAKSKAIDPATAKKNQKAASSVPTIEGAATVWRALAYAGWLTASFIGLLLLLERLAEFK